MANRNFSRDLGTLERGMVVLSGYFVVGTDASATANTAAVLANTFPGVTSVTKSSTGTYTLLLQDRYLKLMGISLSVQGGTVLNVKQSTANAVNSATPTITLITTNGSMVETANTTTVATVYVTLFLRNSKGNIGET